jgi:hypothetical protein
VIAPSGRSPVLVLIAARRIYPTLQQRLDTAEWERIRPDLDAALTVQADPAEQVAAALAVVRALATSPVARGMLAARLAAQDELLALCGGGADGIYPVLAASDLVVPGPAEPEPLRRITLKAGGVGGARSIKLTNFHLDFVELLKIGSSAAASLSSALVAPNPLVIASSVLTIVQSLVEAVTTTIGEDTASVFWSFVQTAGQRGDKTATEAEVRAAADKERREFGLVPLRKADFAKALRALESLSSITPAGPGRWRLAESYHVRS